MGIRFDRNDLARALPPQVGWQKLKIVEFKEEVAAQKPGKARTVNYIFTFEVTASAVDDKNIGRSITRYYNSSARGFLIPLLAAVWNLTQEKAVEKIASMPENEEIDLESLKETEVWNELIEGVYNERPQIQVSDNWSHGEGEPPF